MTFTNIDNDGCDDITHSSGGSTTYLRKRDIGHTIMNNTMFYKSWMLEIGYFRSFKTSTLLMLTSMMTEPSFIRLTISSVTKIGVRPDLECIAPITTSALIN